MAKRDGKVNDLPDVATTGAIVDMAPRFEGRSIQEIIDEFWTAINNHPDVKLLTCSLGGRPLKGTEFQATPISQQHNMEIRFVYREGQAVESAKSNQPGAYEPGGKFHHLLPKKDEATAQEPNGAKKSWEHLLPPSRKQQEQPVEAGA